MERGHPLDRFIGREWKKPHCHESLFENNPEVLEPAREAVYK
jgi:hypothetical protein